MTALATMLADHGELTGPDTLRIARLLPGPIERVWAYLTESALRRQWLAAGEMVLEPGTGFELVWRNDELNETPGQRPEGFPAEHRMRGQVTAVDAPRRLDITWGTASAVRFTLAAQGDQVLLTILHQRLPDRASLLNVSAGWHRHLDMLEARATGRPAPDFWSGWQRLKADYATRLPE
ncbi:SRPBCC family protein [Falsiroseomonas selenitidurans]|uniref:SRPBCC family protein n=1 Tax=Falsiroseomonas selenitidurans TaxID=2716335 RepID=A0ABX1E422_9PROT|nr:SRPBCC family protein [Falsiroseomonas selenitidurans]NKC31937.1 SRPBCC family protein [Falsiroseomonas selenitidurans]